MLFFLLLVSPLDDRMPMSEGGQREIQLIFPFSIFFHFPSSSLILPSSSPLSFFFPPFSYPSLPLLLLPASPNLSHLELNLPRSHQTRNRLNRHSRRHYRRHDSFGHRQSFRKFPSPPALEFFLSFFLLFFQRNQREYYYNQ